MGQSTVSRAVHTGRTGEVSHGGQSPSIHSPRPKPEVIHGGCSQDCRGYPKDGDTSIQASFVESAREGVDKTLLLR